jgi:hypothetical protein
MLSFVAKNRFFFICSFTTVALTLISYCTSARAGNEQLLANNTSSVWDAETQSYAGNKAITVYRSPSCGCCGEWIEHMEKHGFEVTEIKIDDLNAIKEKYNLPPQLESCHTAIIDGYVIEGHVPADDVKIFLQEKPNLAGLAVPGMPLGSPGMEAGDRKQPFDVMSFNKEGEIEVFQEHESY